MTKTDKTPLEVAVATRSGGHKSRIQVSLPAGCANDNLVEIAGEHYSLEDFIAMGLRGDLSLKKQVQLQSRFKAQAAQIQKLEKQIDKGLTHEVLREEVFGLKTAPKERLQWNFTRKETEGSEGVPIAHMSDLHMGETVSPTQMSGYNAFDLEIFDTRWRRATQKIIDIAGPGHHPGLIMLYGGDNMSGDIHEELAESNALHSGPTLLRLFNRMAWQLGTLANRFGKVAVVMQDGNHDRMGKKLQAKNSKEVSFDTILYMMLEDKFRSDQRLTFVYPNESITHFIVNDHRYALTHGHLLGVKGGDGIIGSLGPITRGAIKTRSSEASLPIPRNIDTLVMGHWHKLMYTPGIFVNGSIKGFDEYARDFLRVGYEPPQQAMWFNHPSKGPARLHKIFVDPNQPKDKTGDPGDWFRCDLHSNDHWHREMGLSSDWDIPMPNPPQPPKPSNDNMATRRPRRQRKPLPPACNDDLHEPTPSRPAGQKATGAKPIQPK